MMLIHIILGILKIIGILLLVLLCLVLLVLLSLLFSPVRYRAAGYRDSQRYEGSVGISWLLHVVHVSGRITSDGEGLKLNIRLFGIPVLTVLEKIQAFREKRRKRAAGKQEKKPDLKAAELPESPKLPKSADSAEPAKISNEKEESEPTGRSPAKALGVQDEIPGKIKKALSNFRLTAGKICDKIKAVRELMASEPFCGAKTLVFGELRILLGHVRPRKVSGKISFGFENPALTGQVLAAASAFYPLYGRQFSICPYFDRTILEGSVKISGRMYGFVFLRTVLRLVLNRDVKELRKKIGH